MTVQACVNPQVFVSPDEIRGQFSQAMSALYKAEVPLYGSLLTLVAQVNRHCLAQQPALAEQLRLSGEVERLELERHGAIRLGSAAELATIGRLFAVMGMHPVGYYDLVDAGVPVHATAFRAIDETALQCSPFRVFTSLLRLELIDDPRLRELADDILARRQIFTPRTLQLIEHAERVGGLDQSEATEFVEQALETFRWQRQATVSMDLYRQLSDQHRLIADVVAFKGPHINHLTPRTLDIDVAQAGMARHGMAPKAVIEGAPPRRCPILLRQTSFKAVQEPVVFSDGAPGNHSARFGEIEQRGAALTGTGRALYDRLLRATREAFPGAPTAENAASYMAVLAEQFAAFPDDYPSLRQQGLAYFRYSVSAAGLAAKARGELADSLDGLVEQGHLGFEPLIYEDFLPVSAAGIFQSNLGDATRGCYGQSSSRDAFEYALGAPLLDELALYAATQQRSLERCVEQLGLPGLSLC